MTIRIILFAMALMGMSNSASAQNAACSSFSASSFQSNVQGGLLECAVNPDLMRIRVYKMALCTSLPTYSDTSSCEFIYNAPTGRVVSISSGTSAPLTGVFELSYGSYPYVYIVIDNTVAFRSTFSLPDPVGVMTTVQQPVQNGYGTTCWTNGNDAKQDFTNDPQPVNIDCGITPNAQVSTEIFRSFTDNMIASVPGIPGVGGDTFDVHLVAENGNLATIVSQGNLFVSSDADKMVLIQHSASPLVVDESTTNIDFGFATTNRMNVMFFPCSIGGNADECAAYGFSTGFQIHATAQ
jgi:hypothetical protein